ncbi:MAG: S8 family serine peptidase, partial [Paludibacteraceae bacterium]|nr:S8 family serine peptidase [Paludibacteraceae bacterium]
AMNVEVCDATAVNDPRDPRTPRPSTRQSFVTNDPMYSLQWGFTATSLDSLLMQPKLDSTAPRKIIAFLDTGVDVDHPDLAGNIWTNSGEQNGTAGQDDDNNGFADDIHGWDFVNQSGLMRDNNSHGTHCAGIAAAVGNNGIGITGANPDALIMPVTVMQSDGRGSVSTIVQGVNYAAQNGADVISMSIGAYTSSLTLEQALGTAYQSCLIVAAAGNDALGIDPRCTKKAQPCFPAAYSFVIGVQATAPYNGLASFSNWDCDGPNFSQYNEVQQYNYEISAPGVSILSTVPNGQYRYYNGTSMACPMVAGGLSALIERREYPSKEVLLGEIINRNEMFQHINFMNLYNADSTAPMLLRCVAIEINDTLYGDGSWYADAGEHIQLYPTLKNFWGSADSIKLWVECQEFEDTSVVDILSGVVEFGWPLSSYAQSKSANPLDLAISANLVDGRVISLNLCAVTPSSMDTMRHPFTIKITNGEKIGGLITANDTLWPHKQYIVTNNIAIAPEVTLVIKPGTVLKFQDGVSFGSSGKVIAVGTPDSMITFTSANQSENWGGLSLSLQDSLSYCIFENIFRENNVLFVYPHVGSITDIYVDSYGRTRYGYTANHISHSIIRNNYGSYITNGSLTFSNCNFQSNIVVNMKILPITHYDNSDALHGSINRLTETNNNFCKNTCFTPGALIYQGDLSEVIPGNNIFNNVYNETNAPAAFQTVSTTVWNEPLTGNIYLGSTVESIVKKGIYDFDYPNNPYGTTYGRVDVSNMAMQPFAEAHGIVWKIEVQGFDAQDEYDSIIPLGPGTHEFKVYFNRAMDISVEPTMAMGVRPPYTQIPIQENSFWNSDSTIWTTHVTLSGHESIDGINRLFVAGAKDIDHFEIPVEDLRFNVEVASSGALSAGFQATAGAARIELEWNDQEVNYDDFLGFNLYRFRYDSIETNYHYDWDRDIWCYDTIWTPVDTIVLNDGLLMDTTYVDYDVEVGVRYY